MKEEAHSEHAVVFLDPADHDLEALAMLELERFPGPLDPLESGLKSIDRDRMRFLGPRDLKFNGRDDLVFVMN